MKDAGGKAIGVSGARGSFGNRNNPGKLVVGGGNDLFYFNPTNEVIKNL